MLEALHHQAANAAEEEREPRSACTERDCGAAREEQGRTGPSLCLTVHCSVYSVCVLVLVLVFPCGQLAGVARACVRACVRAFYNDDADTLHCALTAHALRTAHSVGKDPGRANYS